MNANDSSDNTEPEVIEQGDIYLFYKPKKDADNSMITSFRAFVIVKSGCSTVYGTPRYSEIQEAANNSWS